MKKENYTIKKEEVIKIENWIKSYVKSSGAKGVVLGMSGGKDSLVTAQLCANALGKENVIGLIMPNGKMKDNEIATLSCKLIGIRHYEVDVNSLYNIVLDNIDPILKAEDRPLSPVSTINTPPRLRMLTLYAVAGSMNYLVANTSNLSEAEVGYTTKWGDNVGDFGPLANFTTAEVCEIGMLLGLPRELVYKIPDDGLSGQSDEEKLGFTYEEENNYIRKGIKGEKFDKISHMHKISEHKRVGVAKYKNDYENNFENL